MELRVLNYFLTVAREENFTRAAEQLHVTQPTLSRQIAELEAELGVKLFKRGSHNIMLTDDGMLLKRRAQEIVSLAERTKQDFLCKEENIEGTVSIGSGEFLSTRLLTDCIAAFRKKYPHVRYELYSGNADSIKESIERGLLDMGLVTEPIEIRKYEFVSMPVREQWGALVREGSPLAAKEYKAGLMLQRAQICPVFTCAGEHDCTDMEKGTAVFRRSLCVYRFCEEIHLEHI